VRDCEIGFIRWNRLIEKAGFDFKLALPSERFNRTIGLWGGVPTDTKGAPISRDQFEQRRGEFMPSAQDRAYVHSLMVGVYEPGKTAGWISPPDRGINGQPVEFEYVRAG
jgi:benzoyl-CoA 2,3-dioxygenase component B